MRKAAIVLGATIMFLLMGGLLLPQAALACAGCAWDGPDPDKAKGECFDPAPDGPAAICVSGGGNCTEEGTCKNDSELSNAEGSAPLQLESSPTRLAFALGTTDVTVVPTRRQCDQAIVARSYLPAFAEQLRQQTSSLVI